MPDTPRTPAPGIGDRLELLEEGDDGAIHRFYEWLRQGRYMLELDKIERAAFVELVERYNGGQMP